MVCWSLSVRRAWIEISMWFNAVKLWVVALRKESVDRNIWRLLKCCFVIVALRKESVDRNITLPVFYAFSKVALRKESVDRNVYGS